MVESPDWNYHGRVFGYQYAVVPCISGSAVRKAIGQPKRHCQSRAERAGEIFLHWANAQPLLDDTANVGQSIEVRPSRHTLRSADAIELQSRLLLDVCILGQEQDAA
jgi:hypothetical protein